MNLTAPCHIRTRSACRPWGAHAACGVRACAVRRPVGCCWVLSVFSGPKEWAGYCGSTRWAGGRPCPTKGRSSERALWRQGVSMVRRVIGGSFLCSIGAVLLATSTALAAAPHPVMPGESLWSIAYANNLTTRTVAVYNGVPESSELVVGTTVYVPTVEEGAAALASGTPGIASPAPAGGGQAATPSGMGDIPSPYGELHLVSAAADAWNA